MPIWRYNGLGSGLLAFLMSTVMPVGKADAQAVGKVGSVNPNATGTPPGRSATPLAIGRGIVRNERIQTNDNGTAQIMFDDRSALNVGRNSTVTVDRFVYSGGEGSQALTLARGAARFVGGNVSHGGGSSVNTPVATVGIRGGNVTILHLGSNTTVMVHNGIALVATQSGSQTLRAGFQIVVGPGGFLGGPTRINMQTLREATRLLASIGRQTGGAVRLPQDADAARNQIGTPRAPARTPNFDLPAAGDQLIRGRTTTENQPETPPYIR